MLQQKKETIKKQQLEIKKLKKKNKNKKQNVNSEPRERVSSPSLTVKCLQFIYYFFFEIWILIGKCTPILILQIKIINKIKTGRYYKQFQQLLQMFSILISLFFFSLTSCY